MLDVAIIFHMLLESGYSPQSREGQTVVLDHSHGIEAQIESQSHICIIAKHVSYH